MAKWAHRCLWCAHEWAADTSSPAACPVCGTYWAKFISTSITPGESIREALDRAVRTAADYDEGDRL